MKHSRWADGRISSAELDRRCWPLLEGDEHAPTAIRDAGARGARRTSRTRWWRSSSTACATAQRIADLGSGGGLARPGARGCAARAREVALVESQRASATFIDGRCAAAGIENARVVCARAEEWREGARAIDVVARPGARAAAGGAGVRRAAAACRRNARRLARHARAHGAEAAADRAAASSACGAMEVRRVVPFAGAHAIATCTCS